jgi:D-tyrosyl-tRNA(Tyr) deacylase
MRAVVQRVLQASVSIVEGESRRETGVIAGGLLILVGVRTDDTEADAHALAEKAAGLRVFEDEDGKLNLSLRETGGSALIVSNFTLYGDCRKGRRPSFSEAAPSAVASPLFHSFGAFLTAQGIPTQVGAFGEEMQITLVNDGPVTLLLDSRRIF